MSKTDRLKEIAAQNPRASATQVEDTIRVVEQMRELGVRRHEYALSGPFRKFRGIPDTPRKRRVRAARNIIPRTEQDGC